MTDILEREFSSNDEEIEALRAEVEALRADYAELSNLVTSQGIRLMEAEDDSEIERLRAENAKLREAMRNHVIVTGLYDEERRHCIECNSGWDYDLPERHAPGCLAAQEGER